MATKERTSSQIIEIEEAQRMRKQKREEDITEGRLKKKKTKKDLDKKSKSKMSRGKKITAAVVVAFSVSLLGFYGMKLIDLSVEKSKAIDILEQKQIEKESLEKEFAMVNDPEYIEAQARDRFHMLKEGEILYVFPPKETDNSQ
jgi:Septum formation initiator.